MTFQVRVYGSPVPQGRPRATVIGGHAHVYERKQDKDWKQVVRAHVLNKVLGAEVSIYEGAIKLDLCFHMERPKSLPKKVKHHTKKPDCDNLAKAVKDCLKGLVYKDDSQVVLLTVRKLYDSPAGVSIFVESL